MVFVGGGALLSHAVGHALALGLPVAVVCCPVGDPALPRLARLGVTVLSSDDPNADLPPQLAAPGGKVVFSINNRFLLSDALLASGPRFYNIHNGLVQRYRGLAEVCVVAAICRGEAEYGATLHRLLPGQKVDTGPVVGQQAFAVAAEDDFPIVFGRGLDACKHLYEQHLAAIAAGDDVATPVDHAGKAFGYKDVARLCAEASPERRRRASRLGPYQAFFPTLAAQLADVDRHAAA
jgi:methionyl-tRNA formyltransferase